MSLINILKCECSKFNWSQSHRSWAVDSRRTRRTEPGPYFACNVPNAGDTEVQWMNIKRPRHVRLGQRITMTSDLYPLLFNGVDFLALGQRQKVTCLIHPGEKIVGQSLPPLTATSPACTGIKPTTQYYPDTVYQKGELSIRSDTHTCVWHQVVILQRSEEFGFIISELEIL